MHDGSSPKTSETMEKEEVLRGVLDFAECLPALRRASSACNEEKLISVLCRVESYARKFVEQGSSVVDCQKIKNSACKQYLVKDEFERDLIIRTAMFIVRRNG